MELTKVQAEGLRVAVERYKTKQPYTCISGFAGSGKSTLVQFIIDALNIHEDDVVFATFTGKASLVLRNKGCQNAMTLHRLLYIPKVDSDGEVEFEPRETLEQPYKLIVVDEVSMVSKEIWDLLLSHKVYIIALGDPFQIPSVSAESVDILDHPHVFLTEIMRQALDSPIIRLSMDIREGRRLQYGGSREARIIPKEKVSDALLLGADQILCGKNLTRHSLNERVRKLRWGHKYQTGPIEGDKIIALKNDWQFASDNGEALINGELGTIHKIKLSETKLLKPKLVAQFCSDTSGVFNKVMMDYQLLCTGAPTVTKDNYKEFYKREKPKEFAYGYAVTTHKFQGSQADKVLCFAERMGDEEFFRRWLYTAATRAVDKCIIVM